MISFGPLGSRLIMFVFDAPASARTNPGSSHRDDKIKQSAYFKYLKTFDL